MKKEKLKLKNEDGASTKWKKHHDEGSGYSLIEMLWILMDRVDELEKKVG